MALFVKGLTQRGVALRDRAFFEPNSLERYAEGLTLSGALYKLLELLSRHVRKLEANFFELGQEILCQWELDLETK